MQKKSKWGYMGANTALNGLTDWMYTNTDENSRRRMLNKIIQFGLEHELINKTRHINYDDKRSVEDAADAVAKVINGKKDLFQLFTNWVLSL
jgi:hypothetical protein